MAQIVLGMGAGFAEAERVWTVLGGAAAAWAVSVWLGARWMAGGG
jgi:hypothetical protein